MNVGFILCCIYNFIFYSGVVYFAFCYQDEEKSKALEPNNKKKVEKEGKETETTTNEIV